jgi:cell division protein FtsB
MSSRSVQRQPAREPSMNFSEQMRDFVRRNLSWFLAAALALLLLQDIFGAHGLVAMRRSQDEAERIQKEIKQINEENSRLEGHVKKLKTDPQSIERIAREEMGLARPGEYIFKLPPNATDASSHSAQAPAAQSQKP